MRHSVNEHLNTPYTEFHRCLSALHKDRLLSELRITDAVETAAGIETCQYAVQFLLVHKPHNVADHPRSGKIGSYASIRRELIRSLMYVAEAKIQRRYHVIFSDGRVAVPSRHQHRRPVVAWLRAIRRIRYNQSDHLCTCARPRSRGTVIPDGTEKIKPIQAPVC